MNGHPAPSDPRWGDVFAVLGGALRDRVKRWRMRRRWNRYRKAIDG